MPPSIDSWQLEGPAMTPERWKRVAHLYESALERDPLVRAAFVAQACSGDDLLRREVESLLAHEGTPLVVDQEMMAVAVPLLVSDGMLEPNTQLGPYRLERLVGAGGMGHVYRATDTRLNRTVAIKVLPEALAEDAQFRARFEREAHALAGLTHPHICTLYDVGHQDASADQGHAVDYLVLEYVEGEPLDARLQRGALPSDHALTCAIQIADALDAAHRRGIVHRDLKPGNIMLTKGGAKLLDFGLAKPTVPAIVGLPPSHVPTTPPALTAQGTILGTFQYMAPEQLEGQEADARTDIFAFGAVVYEMVTGKKAFGGKSHASLIGAIMHAEPPPISSLQPLTPPLLDRVVRRCLAKDPDERWQTSRDLASQLHWVESAPPTESAVSDAVGASHVRVGVKRREGMAWTAAAVMTIVGIAMLASSRLPGRRIQDSASEHPVVRSMIPPPENTVFDFDVTVGPVAISPDGH